MLLEVAFRIRLRRQTGAAGAEVPLQIADPQHQFGHGGGARVDFQPEKLVRVDAQTFGFQRHRGAQFAGLVQHFAFQPLQVFQRDVQEVAAAAGRVEYADVAQLMVKAADFGACGVDLAFARQRERGRLNIGPLHAQRLDDGGQHEALDIAARRVVGAERVAFVRVERAFEQGAEDGRLDLAPVGARGFAQQHDLFALERQHLGLLEQLAVEARQRVAQHGGKTADIHFAPQRGEQRHELLRVPRQVVEQGAEAARRQQAHVFGEHRKQAAGEKAGDGFGVVAVGFERFGDAGQPHRDVARHLAGNARRVEGSRVEPHGAQARPDLGLREVVEPDAVAARVRVGRVGGAAARELGVQLDHAADVDHDDEGRTALGHRQCSGCSVRPGCGRAAVRRRSRGYGRRPAGAWLPAQRRRAGSSRCGLPRCCRRHG
jgi:hypothetical protein